MMNTIDQARRHFAGSPEGTAALLSFLFFFALFAGCASVPPSVTSKIDALARARTVYGASAGTGRRLELPASNTGTGPFDFYNLFATFSTLRSDPTYGIGIATTKKLSHLDGQITAEGFGELKIEARQRISASLGKKVNYVEAILSQALIAKATSTGARIHFMSSGVSMEFVVPDWMFTALTEAVEKDNWHRKFVRGPREQQLARQQIRELYVKEHPGLPEDTKDAILKGVLILGMSPDDARASWGKPQRINRSVGAYGVHEQWIYGSTYVYFDDGVLKSWQDSR